MRRQGALAPRPWSPRFLGEGVQWAPCLGDAWPGWHQHHRRPGPPQGELRADVSFPSEHPSFGQLAEFGESSEVATPPPARNTGLRRTGGFVQCQGFVFPGPVGDKGVRRFGGFVQCHMVARTRPLKDQGLRRFGGFVQCHGFGSPGPLKDKGLRRYGFLCKPHRVNDFEAVQHQSLWRFLRDFAMGKDPTPGPFGLRGHESSDRKMAELLRTSQDFGLGMEQDSHCGWILGKLRALQFLGWVQLPLSCLDNLGHDWNLIEHHCGRAA